MLFWWRQSTNVTKYAVASLLEVLRFEGFTILSCLYVIIDEFYLETSDYVFRNICKVYWQIWCDLCTFNNHLWFSVFASEISVYWIMLLISQRQRPVKILSARSGGLVWILFLCAQVIVRLYDDGPRNIVDCWISRHFLSVSQSCT